MRVKKILTGYMIAIMGTALMTGCSEKSDSQFKSYAKCAKVDVTAYTDIEYVPESREVTDDEVKDAIDQFCADNTEHSEDKTSPVKDGDEVHIDYTKTVSGAESDNQSDYSITIGSDTLGEGSDAQIIGMKAGESKKISVTYPDDYDDVTMAGLTAEYDVKVNYIDVSTVPEYTDELVKTATNGEYTTTDAYTTHLTEELQNDKNHEADEADKTTVIKAVVDKVSVDKYPEAEVQSYVQDIVSNMKSMSESYGIDFGTYASYMGYTDEKSFLEYLYTTVESVMKEKIVISRIALDNNLVADDEDIANYKKHLMEEQGIEDEAEIDNYYSQKDLMFYATEENVLEFLMGRAVQVESTEETSTEEAGAETVSTESDSTEEKTE